MQNYSNTFVFFFLCFLHLTWLVHISIHVAEMPARPAPARRPRSALISSPTSSSPAASSRFRGRADLPRPQRRATGPARRLRRRPARPEGAIHHPGRSGRDRDRTTGHLPVPADRQRAAPRGRRRDPNIVLFDRYTFDLSRLAGGAHVPPSPIPYGNGFLSDLLWPDPRDTELRGSRPVGAPSCTTVSSRRSTRSPS